MLAAKPLNLIDDESNRPLLTLVPKLDPTPEELFKKNFPFVIYIVKSFQRAPVSQEELIQAGSIGLWKAVCKFDHEREKTFSFYMEKCIRGSVLTAIRCRPRDTKIEKGDLNMAIKVRNAQDHLANKQCTKPSSQHIADLLHVPIEEVERAMLFNLYGSGLISISQSACEEGDPLESVIPSNEKTPEDWLMEKELREKIDYIMQTKITDKQRQFIDMHFGRNGYEEHSYADIANYFNISRERVRQILHAAYEKIRNVDQLRLMHEQYT